MIQLEPCPFCGGKAHFNRIPGEGLFVLCSSCGALAAQRADTGNEALAKAWNMRTVRYNFSNQSKIGPCPFCADGGDDPAEAAGAGQPDRP